MRIFLGLLVLVSFSVHAETPFMSVKDRVRLSLWIEGVSQQPVQKKTASHSPKRLPEEIERALQKI